MSYVQGKERSDISISPSSSFSTPKSKQIVILGGAFAGIGVLKAQKDIHNYDNIEITLIDQDNFFLFTPMLPEVASGMIETRHIVTPVRSFVKRQNFMKQRYKLLI